MSKAEQERERLRRKKGFASADIDRFHDDISRNELIIADLEAMPQADRGESWQTALDHANAQIKSLRRQIKTREAIITELEPTTEEAAKK